MRDLICVRIGALLTVGVLSCSSPPPWPHHKDIHHATVPCVVRAGESMTDRATPLIQDSVGAQACARALEAYLRDHPDERVGLVTPFVTSPEKIATPTNESRSGTSTLLIEYTTSPAPWPSARRLAVRDVACIDSTSCSSQTSSIDCATAIRGNPQRDVWQWIPLISDSTTDATRCTRDILYLYERDE